MASSGVNVLRWGALAFGVFYGFSHQSSIYSKEKAIEAQHEYDRKSKLISDAKAAFAAKNAPPNSDGVITNIDDPKFDLEAYINKAVKESA